MVLGGVLASGLLSNLFVGYDPALAAITKRGFILYSLAYAFIGVNIYASSFFTALGNGLVSAVISFLRTLLFQVATLLILPLLFDVDGIWCSVVAAELMALAFSLFFFITQRKKYGYA